MWTLEKRKDSEIFVKIRNHWMRPRGKKENVEKTALWFFMGIIIEQLERNVLVWFGVRVSFTAVPQMLE